MRRLLAFTFVITAVAAISVLAAPDKKEHKVTICHVPPGNPANAHSITIDESALPAHLLLHGGDTLGPCVINPSGSR